MPGSCGRCCGAWTTTRSSSCTTAATCTGATDPMRELVRDCPRLDLNLLPPYAPELNPVEQLWNLAKDKELCNFVPHNVAEANAGVTRLMDNVRHDQLRLRSFYRATPLSWDPLTIFF